MIRSMIAGGILGGLGSALAVYLGTHVITDPQWIALSSFWIGGFIVGTLCVYIIARN